MFSRFIYEKSVSYRGYLIIPFVLTCIDNIEIYSYALISSQGHQDQLHQQQNPSGLTANNLEEIIQIAQEYLAQFTPNYLEHDYFKERYTYQDNLIIIHQERHKCFYDHYPPTELRNIAAPKLFAHAYDCLNWVKKGLDQHK